MDDRQFKTLGTHIAHVADSIERLSDGEINDYDATADFAANLLDVTDGLVTAVRMYDAGAMSADDFDSQVKVAVDTYPDDDESADDAQLSRIESSACDG